MKRFIEYVDRGTSSSNAIKKRKYSKCKALSYWHGSSLDVICSAIFFCKSSYCTCWKVSKERWHVALHHLSKDQIRSLVGHQHGHSCFTDWFHFNLHSIRNSLWIQSFIYAWCISLKLESLLWMNIFLLRPCLFGQFSFWWRHNYFEVQFCAGNFFKWMQELHEEKSKKVY